MLGHVRGNTTAEELHHRRTLRGTYDEEIHAHCCSEIDNCRGGVLAYGVKRNHVDAALGPELTHRAHDSICFRVVLPVGAAKRRASCRVINSDFFNIEHKQHGFAQLRFVQGKAEHACDSACSDHDFLAFLQPWLHTGHEIRRDHLGDFARHRQRGEALPFQRVSAQRQAADQNREHKLKCIDFRMRQR